MMFVEISGRVVTYPWGNNSSAFDFFTTRWWMVAVCLLFLFYKREQRNTEYTQHNRTLSHISAQPTKNNGEASRRAMVFTKEKGGGKRWKWGERACSCSFFSFLTIVQSYLWTWIPPSRQTRRSTSITYRSWWTQDETRRSGTTGSINKKRSIHHCRTREENSQRRTCRCSA